MPSKRGRRLDRAARATLDTLYRIHTSGGVVTGFEVVAGDRAVGLLRAARLAEVVSRRVVNLERGLGYSYVTESIAITERGIARARALTPGTLEYARTRRPARIRCAGCGYAPRRGQIFLATDQTPIAWGTKNARRWCCGTRPAVTGEIGLTLREYDPTPFGPRSRDVKLEPVPVHAGDTHEALSARIGAALEVARGARARAREGRRDAAIGCARHLRARTVIVRDILKCWPHPRGFGVLRPGITIDRVLHVLGPPGARYSPGVAGAWRALANLERVRLGGGAP